MPVGESNQGKTQTPIGQMISISASIDFVSEQLKSLLTSFPPFFPVGSPQRVDLIKEIKDLQGKIEMADIPAPMKTIAGPSLSKQASDKEIDGALKGLMQFRDVALNIKEASGASEAGKVLNLSI